MKSKTREAARAYSRQASIHSISQANLPLAQISGTQKVGSVSVDQLGKGIDFPNVQSAIDDLTNLYQTPINGVVMYTDSAKTPAGISMIERLTVSGESTGTSVEVYGIKIAIGVGENQDLVTTKIIAELDKYKDKGIAFKSVTKTSGSNSKIDVQFLDTNPHDNFVFRGNGMTIVGTTETTAVPGYGTWSKIGEQDVKFGSEAATKLYYYKRIA